MMRGVQRIVPGRPWPGPRLPCPALSDLGRDLRALGPADLVLERPRVGREPGRFLAMTIPWKSWGGYRRHGRGRLCGVAILGAHGAKEVRSRKRRPGRRRT